MKKDHKYLIDHPDDLDYADNHSILWVLWRVIGLPIVFLASIIALSLTAFWLAQIKATEDVKAAIIALAVLCLIVIFFLVYRWFKSWKV
jgi:hypothetical protein